MAGYFYELGEQEIGPVSATELRALAKTGSITPTTMVRKSNSTEWIVAARFKNLFESVPSGTGSAAAERSTIDRAKSAAISLSKSIRNLVPGERKLEPPIKQLVVSATPTSRVQRFLNEEQDPEAVSAALTRVEQILMQGEDILYVAVQQRPVVNVLPDCVVLTNRRFLVYRRRMLGRADFSDYRWRDLHDAQLHEGMLGATLTFRVSNGEKLAIDYLPKPQARMLYRHAQEMEETALEERRSRTLEEKRAAAGGVFVQNSIPGFAAAPASSQEGDPVQRLQQLKQMLDAGLVSAQEYEAKKAEILSRM